MVKYGKEFRKKQIDEYKNKYFNYKEYKQLIKKMLKENLSSNDINQTQNQINEFTEKLNIDLKKIFIYFVKDERILYKKINSHLYRRDNYKDYQSQEFVAELYELYGISNNSLNLSSYVYYNIKAIFKILKKFNKKIVKDPNKDLKNDFITSNLKDENSDLLYIYKFKIIDEVNILIEDLIKTLKKSFRFHMSLLGKVNTSSKQEKLNQNDDLYFQKFKDFYNKTKINLKLIDKNAFGFKFLFLPWNNYIKDKDELSSKLRKIRNNSINSDEITDKNSFDIPEQSLLDKIFFSKENIINITCTLIHTFLYMFTYSIIIPNNYYYLIHDDGFDENENDKAYLYYALIMVSVPVGTIISFTYETILVKNSTKKPVILSLSLQILGNILYIIEVSIDNFHSVTFLCLSRIFIGLSAIRTTNKIYLANFLPKNKINIFINIFDICTMLGLGSGFIINLIFFNKNELEIIRFKIGNYICISLSIMLLLIDIFFFKEAKSKDFLKKISEIESITDESSIKEEIENDSKMVNEINSQLGDFNKKNKYDDTNLVTKNVFENINSAKKGLKSLIKSFIVFSTIVFTSKFINEFFFIITPLYCKRDKTEINIDKNILLYPPIILGVTCYIIPFIELIFYKISKISNEKTILFTIYAALLILNISKLFFVIFFEKKNDILLKNPFFILAISFSIILARFVEKASSLFFSNIMPNEFNIFGINGNICINTISHIGRVLGAFLPFLLAYMDFHNANIIFYSIMTFFSLISFIIFTFYYNDLRIKAISRIIHQQKPKFEVVTEI